MRKADPLAADRQRAIATATGSEAAYLLTHTDTRHMAMGQRGKYWANITMLSDQAITAAIRYLDLLTESKCYYPNPR